ITDTSFWAQPRKPLGDWSFPDGAFGLSESPRSCDITGCIVSNWYGDFPILYFFPELERMILRNYKEYIRPDGAIPFLYPHGDLTKPTYEWLLPLNGPCFADLVGRLWLRTGNDDILREFYPAVKKNTIFTMNLKPAPEGIISVPWEGAGQEWWEHSPVYGMVSHVAGMRLSNLSIAGRMAEHMGDGDFADKCRDWYEQGSKLMEEKLWVGDTYMFYRDPGTGKESDDIMSSQLDGDFANYIHGFKGVFRDDRAKKVLETIEKTCLVSCGVAGFASHAGDAQLDVYGTFTAEIIMVGMTYMYHGMYELGMDIIHRNMDNLVRQQRHAWDLPNLIRCDTNERTFGTDYFQMMILWAVPAAMQVRDVSAPCKHGGLVDRVIRAGQPFSSAVYKDE
ncbi:MAG: GH116 family glycosyl hydrolase, partial [Clostridiales bacterium]|nr:GH116 family glycosyl hydrolase [Clostridiales bacterium]